MTEISAEKKPSTVNVKIQSLQKQKSKFAYSDSFATFFWIFWRKVQIKKSAEEENWHCLRLLRREKERQRQRTQRAPTKTKMRKITENSLKSVKKRMKKAEDIESK